MKILSIETENGIAGYQSRFGGAASLLRPVLHHWRWCSIRS